MKRKFRSYCPIIFISMLLVGILCISCKKEAPKKATEKPNPAKILTKEKAKKKEVVVVGVEEVKVKEVKPKPPAQPIIEKPSPDIGMVKNYLKETDTQLVEGFAAINAFSRSDNYDSWKGKVQSWWEYSDKKDQKVVWYSGKCPEKKNTTLVFSGLLGVATGEAQLYVNDKPVLTFNTGIGPEIEEWKKGNFQLKFFALRVKPNQERLGIFCLTVPKEEIIPGKPIKLRVTGYKKTGRGNSFFMLSGFPETLKKLSLD